MINYISTLLLGMVIASVIATLAKFKVESLSYAVALDVGRVTFAWLYVAEGILLCLIFIGCISRASEFRLLSIVVLLALVFAVQVGVLKPQLDFRVDAVLKGVELAPTMVHRVYGGLELAKVFLLLYLSFQK